MARPSRPVQTTLVVAATVAVIGGGLLAGCGVIRHRDATGLSLPGPASGTPSSSPSPSPTQSTLDSSVSPEPAASDPPPADPSATVLAALSTTLAGQGSHIGVEVLDRVTGAAVGYQASQSFHTASVVKVDILATLLWQHQRSGSQLSDGQRDEAEAMIAESDNDAASELWDDIGGGSGLAAANGAFGLTQTTPGPDGAWGSTATTASDQIRLLSMLTDESGPLSADSRSYELGLLADVESDQRWGVPAAATDAASAVYVKDGWLSASSDNGLWIVNSIGRIVEPGHDWLVAVLSDHHDDEDPGITMVQNAAATAVGGLRSPS